MFVSPQALVVLIVYVLVLISSLVTSLVKHKFSGLTAIGMLFSIIIIGITVYDTHCLTSGSCTAWSWIRTAIYILIPIIVLILWLSNLGKNDADNDTQAGDMTTPDTASWSQDQEDESG